MKKCTKFLLAALAGMAVVLMGRRFLHAPPTTLAEEDDLSFDSDFIPGSRKLNLDLPDHVQHSWFKAPARIAEDQDEMFI